MQLLKNFESEGLIFAIVPNIFFIAIAIVIIMNAQTRDIPLENMLLPVGMVAAFAGMYTWGILFVSHIDDP